MLEKWIRCGGIHLAIAAIRAVSGDHNMDGREREAAVVAITCRMGGAGWGRKCGLDLSGKAAMKKEEPREKE